MSENKTGKPASRTGRYLKYAIGELIVITLGILFALGLDQWKLERADRVLELEYVSRLKADLLGDIARFKSFEEVELYNKRMVLVALTKLKNIEESLDDPLFNRQNLDYSQYVALPETQSATFREMESSGKLNLLQNQEVRLAIDDYYEGYKLISDILSSPVGDYRKIFVNTIPGVAYMNSRINNEDLINTELQSGLHALTTHPDFKSAVNSELHYAANMIYWLRNKRQKCEELLTIIEEGYPMH
jgi:hypothetical protein